jgi:hypothetical protein
MAAVDNRHPSYLERLPEWQMLRASLRGAMAVKEGGEIYLPCPDGFKAQGARGAAMYAAYMMRAQFPDLIRPTIAGIVGIIHRTESTITLPPALEHLREKATPDGLTLESFHRKITNEVLLMGRYGVLADVPIEGGNVFLAGYSAEAIINWSEYFHDLYVLDESKLRREGFAWVPHRRFRVLQLTDGVYQQAIFEYGPQVSIPTGMTSAATGVPQSGMGVGSSQVPDATGPEIYQKTGDEDDPVQTDELIPSTPAGTQLNYLPFVIVGSRDITDYPDDPPMVGVARSALAIYRLDADYRHQLFYSGQETLFCTGVDREDLPEVLGAGMVIGLPSPDAKAFYVGPAAVGISAHRLAITDERQVAVAEGARLFQQSSTGARAESGEALRLRYSSEVSALVEVAKASSAGLELALRSAAMLVGADPEEVMVDPNLEFVDIRMTPQDALALVQVWQAGAISYETLYDNLSRGEVAGEERDSVEEMDLIKQEAPPPIPAGTALLQGDAAKAGNLGIAKPKTPALPPPTNAPVPKKV